MINVCCRTGARLRRNGTASPSPTTDRPPHTRTSAGSVGGLAGASARPSSLPAPLAGAADASAAVELGWSGGCAASALPRAASSAAAGAAGPAAPAGAHPAVCAAAAASAASTARTRPDSACSTPSWLLPGDSASAASTPSAVAAASAAAAAAVGWLGEVPPRPGPQPTLAAACVSPATSASCTQSTSSPACAARAAAAAAPSSCLQPLPPWLPAPSSAAPPAGSRPAPSCTAATRASERLRCCQRRSSVVPLAHRK